MDDATRLALAEQYLVPARGTLEALRARGVAERDVVRVFTLAAVLLHLAVVHTPEVDAARAQLLQGESPPPAPSLEESDDARCLRLAGHHLDPVFQLWEQCIDDGVPNPDVLDVLLSAVRTARADSWLSEVGLRQGMF